MNNNVPRVGRDGFTLIELLAAMVIFAVLAHIMAPSLSGVLRVWRSQGAADQIRADISYARMLAIRSGKGATVVFQSPDRYLVKEGVEPNATVQKTVDLTREYSRVSLQRPAGVDSIVFNPRGMARVGAGEFSVQAASEGTVRSQRFWVSAIGMVRREG